MPHRVGDGTVLGLEDYGREVIDMVGPNGQQPIAAVPILGKQQLTHYGVVVVRSGDEIELDYLVSGYGLDQNGCLMLITNGQVVATYAPGAWRAAWRADIVPEMR